jgi:hypothetical protein
MENKPYHELSLSTVRAMAAGWHFAKDLLTPEELKMLQCIEELLRELEWAGCRHHWQSEVLTAKELAEIAEVARTETSR